MLVVVALASVFTITINERTAEFGILSSLGVGAGRLSGIVLAEGLVIGLVGGFLGAVGAFAGLELFSTPIKVMLSIPRLDTSWQYLLPLAGTCIGLSVAVSLLSSLYSAWKVGRSRLDGLLKGEEL